MEIWPFSEGCVSCLQILRVYSPSFSTLGNKFHFSGQDWGPQHFSEQTLLLLEWLSTAGLFFSTTLAEGFLFLPSPRSPSGPLRRPPQWVAQNGERGAAQDGGSASRCSVRFRCLFSGRLLSLGEPELEVGWGASRSGGGRPGGRGQDGGRARHRGEGKEESKMVVLGT